MAVARHGSGPTAAGRALASQVHPVFMLPPVAMAAFGALLAPAVTPGAAVAHLSAVFWAVYTAHVKDGYIDYHVRGEDPDHPLTVLGCRVGLGVATLGFLLGLGVVYALAGSVAAVVTAPTWVIGYLHAPQLDSTTVGATLGYPVGVALALVGGYVVQTGGVAVVVAALGVVFLLLLTGVKIIDDATDYDYDAGVGKPTVAVVLGRRRARTVAEGFLGMAVLSVLVLVAVDVLPPSSVGASLVFTGVAVFAREADATVATMLLVRGSYLFLAVLVASLWFHPLT